MTAFILPANLPKRRRKTSHRGANDHLEATLQEAVVGFLDRTLAAPATFTAIAHGVYFTGNREEATRRGAKLKRMGLKSGWPDIIILHKGRSLFLELKSATGTLSPTQRIVHQLLVAAGASVTVCRSIDDVRERLEVWGVPTIEAKLPPAERAVLRAKALALN
jgi:hypothetical protein